MNALDVQPFDIVQQIPDVEATYSLTFPYHEIGLSQIYHWYCESFLPWDDVQNRQIDNLEQKTRRKAVWKEFWMVNV
jgi:hypothetical protein